MSVYNNTYDNEINVPLSMTGEKKLHVSQIDFDTSCDCQVTACDGGTIKFCGPTHFDPEPWPPHPEPGGHGTCGDPLDLVVTKILKFDTSEACQIESCPDGTDPITMCSPLILTKDLGTCTIPVPKVFLERLEFDAGSLPYHIISCDVTSRPINFGSPAVFKDFVVLADIGIGTCVTPVPEIVATKLKFGGVSACQIESCTQSTPITFCSPVVFNNGFTFTGDICDDSGGASFEYFNAFDSYYMEMNGATCLTTPTPQRTKVIGKFQEPISNKLSVVFQNGNGPAGGGYVQIDSTTPQPTYNPGHYGLKLLGGSIANNKNVLLQAGGGELNIAAKEDITINAGNSTPYSKILMNSQGDTAIQSYQGDVKITAVGTVDSEIVSTARDAIRMEGDIQPSGGTSYPYATAFTWVQHGEIGHSGAGYWGLPDEGQRVMTNAPSPGDTQTFPNPPPPGIKLWSCNFSPQEEQDNGNGSFIHAGFTFLSEISDITGTALTGDRNLTCTSSILPDGEKLVVDAGIGIRPDPINATFKSAIGSVAKPITSINATTIDADTITTKYFRSSIKTNIGSGYGPAQYNQPPISQDGNPGDKAGDIAFGVHSGPPHGLYFYCCFQDYVGPGVQIWWSSNSFNRTF